MRADNGRANLAGLNGANLDHFVRALAATKNS
jgi:hypothetical protein